MIVARTMRTATALCCVYGMTGCVGVELAHLAGQVATQEISTIARAHDDVHLKTGVKVYPIAMFQQRPMWVTPCEYRGVIVEYSRDWDEVDDAGHVVRKADPHKREGYAVILNKEACPNKQPADIIKVGSATMSGLFGEPKYAIREGHGRTAVNYLDMHPDLRPRWMPQVIRTIKHEAAGNPVAADFLTQMRGRGDTQLFN